MVVVLGAFMSVLDSTIVNIALPRLETAFGTGVNNVQWVLTGYTLAQGVAVPLVAFLTDRLGVKRFYIFSLVAFTIGSAMCGFSWSLPMLILFRILQGLGGAALLPLAMTMLFSVFPPRERGVAMGVFGVPVLLAPAIGPTLGGYLVTYSGWQLIFFINVPVGILAVLLAMAFLRDDGERRHTRFDLIGFCFVTLGMSTVLYGFSSASTDGWSSPSVAGFLVVGVVALLIFIALELRISKRGGQPLLNLNLFANGPFSSSVIANVFVTFSMFGGFFLLPIFLQNMRQLNAYEAGLALLPQAIASMVATIIGGRLVDRLGVKAVMIPGLLMLGISTWYMTFVDAHTSLAWLQFLFILRGLALGVSIQPLSVAMMAEVPPRQLAQASSVSTVTRSVASSLGVAVLATVLSTQSTTHYGHLAEQVTPFSKAGEMLLGLQARFVAQGAAPLTAARTAMTIVSGMIRGQAFILSMQDAFRLTIVTVVAAIIAVFLIRTRRKQPVEALTPENKEEQEEMEKARAEALMVG